VLRASTSTIYFESDHEKRQSTRADDRRPRQIAIEQTLCLPASGALGPENCALVGGAKRAPFGGTAAALPNSESLVMTGAGTDHTQSSREGGPSIILVRPQLAVNIGMCARAMANFGLKDLRLVSPREGWPRTGALKDAAYAAAAGAVHILEGAKLYDSLPAAITDLHYVLATTARERGQHKPVSTPAEAMPEVFQRILAGESLAILFGPERTGLDNDEVSLADALLTFPVNPAYASLNLAQAVLLTGYEWMRASTQAKAPFSVVERSPPAPREMILSFFEYLEGELERTGFFRPPGKQPVMRRNLRNIFHRMQLTEQDVRTLRGMIVRLVEGPRAEASRQPLEETTARDHFAKTEPGPR
jgi:tRNA/rRNA methyltransferase